MNSSDTVIKHPKKDRHPATFGKYQVLFKIGQGAMGAVFKAYDPSIDRVVAIKTISPSVLLIDESGEFKERFLREVRATGKINHPNIISIFDSGELDGTPFFVMEFVDGKELKDFITNGSTLSVDHAKKIICQILDALFYSHNCGVVHRDIKPSNIFIDVNGNVKIADFGIAKQSNSELTQTGCIIGTPSYMSPEQCMGAEVDHRSDIFSAAVVFYEMLTGEKCFNGSSSHTVMHKIISTTPEKPSELNILVPQSIDKILSKAIQKKPDDRFETALEFKKAIENTSDFQTNIDFKKYIVKYSALSIVVVCVVALLVLFSENTDDQKQQSVVVAGAEQHPDSYPTQTQKSPSMFNQSIASAELTEQNKVTRLLKVAKAHKLVGRLVVPQGSNSYDTYKLILDMNPDNAEAKQGLQEVNDLFFKQVNAWVEQGESDKARADIATALLLFPHDERYQSVLSRVVK